MKKTLALFFTLLIANTQTAPFDSVDLYFPDDDVEILTVQNFKKLVENSTTAWFVEFYASWCGYCQRFAPHWKKFATDVAPWRDLVRVAVLDCSKKVNQPICRDFKIDKYPTVRYFHENYTTSSQNLEVVLNDHGDTGIADFVRKKAVKLFIREIKEGRGLVYPNLLPYTHSDVGSLFEGVSDDVEYVLLVVHRSDTYLGAEVALDIHRTPKIVVRYALGNNTALISNLQINKFPTVVVLNRNNNSEVITENISNRTELKAAIGTLLENKGIKIIEIIPDKIQNSSVDPNPVPNNHTKTLLRTLLRQRVKRMGDVIFQTDLEAAFRYSLEPEVSKVKVIKGEQLQALSAYIKVLKKYFPFGYNRTSLIDQLTNLTVNASEIPGSQIQQLMKEKENNRVFSSPQRFLGCEGSSSKYRGYPCSLWILFHYLTINAEHFNVNNRKVNPREVLDAIHGYVKNFFSCAYCSEHFQKMAAERNITSVASLEESVIWLWEAHNVVNKRLSGDATEDPEYPKEQFPTKLRCPECYEEDGAWKRSEVLKYLKRMYGIYNVRYIGSDTSLLFPGVI